MPFGLKRHAMVQLGNGQAIIGGSGNGNYHDKIFLYTCINRNCSVTILSQTLSVPRIWFVAIPISDTMSGCITGGENLRLVSYDESYTNLVSFQTVSFQLLLETVIAMIRPTTCIAALMEVIVVDHA